MAVFLSKNNIEPYQIITSLNPTEDYKLINSFEGYESVEVIQDIYLIIKSYQCERLVLKVENDNTIGSSLYIGKTDVGGNVSEYVKEIIFDDIDTTSKPNDTIIYGLKYKWSLLNNAYLMRDVDFSIGYVNIYETTKDY